MKYYISEHYQDGSVSIIEFNEWPRAMKWLDTLWLNEYVEWAEIRMADDDDESPFED